MRCEDQAELAVRSNVLATALVARAAAAHGARLVYLSTSDVYGSAVAADEETPPAPESLYALTKLWGEQAAALYAPSGLAVLRLANPYGPGVDAGQAKGAVPSMLRQAESREPIPVFRGEARTFCWIGDVVRAIRLVVEAGAEGTFNVGSDGEAVSLADVARVACELTGAPHELIEEVEPPPGRVMTRIATERIRALGWRPEVPLDEGMRQLLGSLRTAHLHRWPKAFVLTGGSRSQLGLLEQARALGHEVCVVDGSDRAPLLAEADHAIVRSFTDVNGVIGELEARGIEPVAVATMGSDQAVLPTAQLAERLGCPACRWPPRVRSRTSAACARPSSGRRCAARRGARRRASRRPSRPSTSSARPRS